MSETQAPSTPTLASVRAGFVQAEELPRANKASIAGTVLGAAGAVLSMVPFLGAVLGAAGLGLAVFGLWDRGGRTRSKTVAVVGIGVGVLGLCAGTLFTVAEENAWHRVKPCNQQAELGIDSRAYLDCLEQHG